MMNNMRWEGKTAEQIIKDITNFMELLDPNGKQQDDYYKPCWSKIIIENNAEYERLNNRRKNIPMLYDKFTGPIFFIGYKDTPRGKADCWYMPLLRNILEMVSILPEPEEINIYGLIDGAKVGYGDFLN